MKFTGSQQIDFQAGDTIGFTWTQNGVITYENIADFPYCEDSVSAPALNSDFTLVAGRYGNRIYALEAFYNPISLGELLFE